MRNTAGNGTIENASSLIVRTHMQYFVSPTTELNMLLALQVEPERGNMSVCTGLLL